MSHLSLLLALTHFFLTNTQKKICGSPEKYTRNTDGITFEQLVKNSELFEKNYGSFKTTSNRIKEIGSKNRKKQLTIAQQAQNTRPIVHERVLKLIHDFLTHKKDHGTLVEKELYKTMDAYSFIDRLLKNRPLMFMGRDDSYLLLQGQGQSSAGFENIGTNNEKAPLLLSDYLSYDEMQISALLGVSVPTYFINNGHRYNNGELSPAKNHQEKGVYVGLVGARFEKINVMESEHMLITQNASSKASDAKQKLLDIWFKFYDKKQVSFDQAKQDKTGRFIKIDDSIFFNTEVYFDTEIYKERMKLVIQPFLEEAQLRGTQENKKAYCHVVGLGLGVWQISDKQPQLFTDALQSVLQEYKFDYISDIVLSYFPEITHANEINGIRIETSNRNPADKLVDNDSEKLLVAMYAWDSNSYPGNEYWAGLLSASGDPAAACCSTITELQNPYINTDIKAEKKLVITGK